MAPIPQPEIGFYTMEKITLTDITLAARESDVEQTPATVHELADYTDDQVGPGKQVTLNFELALAQGEIIDSNFEQAPARFNVGDGNLLPGFELAMFGMRAGEEKTQLIPALKAFGQPREENIHSFPRYRFPADLMMETGLMINFTDSGGNEQPGMISKFDADKVEIDFNHPLAGRDIQFRVKIHGVSPIESSL